MQDESARYTFGQYFPVLTKKDALKPGDAWHAPLDLRTSGYRGQGKTTYTYNGLHKAAKMQTAKIEFFIVLPRKLGTTLLTTCR